MSPSCPISARRIDSHIVRIISFQVALVTILLLLTQESFFAFILFFDFMMRALRRGELSPFQIIAKFVVAEWGLVPKLCDEAPKRFALYLGLVVSLVLFGLYASGFLLLAAGIGVILLICALLETLFDFCIGCKVYYAIQIAKGYFNYDRNVQ